MFSTIARHKLDVIRDVFSKSEHENSAASFYTVHAVEDGRLEPATRKGNNSSKIYKADLDRNTNKSHRNAREMWFTCARSLEVVVS